MFKVGRTLWQLVYIYNQFLKSVGNMTIWTKPLFWIGFHLIGVALTIGMFRLPAMKETALQIPKWVQRAFAAAFFLLPPLIVALLPQPQLTWPALVGIVAGIALFAAMIIIRRKANRELGNAPALREKSSLVTTGIYNQVRNPMYLANLLMGAGWALIFNGVYALLCVPVWFISHAVLIIFEEKGLADEYSEEYQDYKQKTRYRLVPYLF